MLTKVYQNITFLDFDKTDYTWYWIPIIYRWSYLNPPPRGLLSNPPPCLIGCPNPPRPRPEIYQSLINDYIHTWHSKYILKVTWHELFSLFLMIPLTFENNQISNSFHSSIYSWTKILTVKEFKGKGQAKVKKSWNIYIYHKNNVNH